MVPFPPPPSLTSTQLPASPASCCCCCTNELEAQLALKDKELCLHVNSDSRSYPLRPVSPSLPPLFTVSVTPQNSDITTHKITSLLTAHTTLLARLSLLHSRLLHALEKLDGHAQENAEQRRELGVMLRKVQVREEAREGVRRAEDELWEGIGRLVERGASWRYRAPPNPATSFPLSFSLLHIPLPPLLNHPQPQPLRTTHNPPPLHAALHLTSSACTHASPRRGARGESCKAGGRVGGVHLYEGMRAGERETQRERDDREQEGDGSVIGCGRAGAVIVIGICICTVMGIGKRKGKDRIGRDVRGGHGLGLGDGEGDGWGRRSLRDRDRETEEKQIIAILHATVSPNRMLEREIGGLSERLVNARAVSVSVSASASPPESAAPSQPLPLATPPLRVFSTARSTTATIKKVKIRSGSRAKLTTSSALAVARLLQYQPPAALSLPPLAVPPASALSRATTARAPAELLRTLERQISELGDRVDFFAREWVQWVAVVVVGGGGGVRGAGASGSGLGAVLVFGVNMGMHTCSRFTYRSWTGAGMCAGSGPDAHVDGDKEVQRTTGRMNPETRTRTSSEDPFEDLRYRMCRLEAECARYVREEARICVGMVVQDKVQDQDQGRERGARERDVNVGVDADADSAKQDSEEGFSSQSRQSHRSLQVL
ncbi:hypothetical protein CVT25_010275 [Psilocybe cyanescens]|uniref:Uncharacterized protein n=1 Tax=Psilocybe cyanescens TaxID=93625 RepID=A0A409X2R5_PSICY|nr:hypothetical protein CVT25_010275 [Psilocybe cyanescens]